MDNNYGWTGRLTAALSIGNLKAGIAWYRDVLGFELVFEVEEMGYCELRTPVERVTIGLSQVETPSVKGGATLTFGVADIDATRSALEGKGVSFDGPTQTIPDAVKLATFFDPDGNTLMLYQELGSMPG